MIFENVYSALLSIWKKLYRNEMKLKGFFIDRKHHAQYEGRYRSYKCNILKYVSLQMAVKNKLAFT